MHFNQPPCCWEWIPTKQARIAGNLVAFTLIADCSGNRGELSTVPTTHLKIILSAATTVASTP